MAKLTTTRFTAEDLAVIVDQLDRNRASIDAVRVIMQQRGVDSVDVLYAKEFMRGLHKVTRFSGAAHEALTVALLPAADE